MAVYKSATDGELSFEDLKRLGQVDSTEMQQLIFVRDNYEGPTTVQGETGRSHSTKPVAINSRFATTL